MRNVKKIKFVKQCPAGCLYTRKQETDIGRRDFRRVKRTTSNCILVSLLSYLITKFIIKFSLRCNFKTLQQLLSSHRKELNSNLFLGRSARGEQCFPILLHVVHETLEVLYHELRLLLGHILHFAKNIGEEAVQPE